MTVTSIRATALPAVPLVATTDKLMVVQASGVGPVLVPASTFSQQVAVVAGAVIRTSLERALDRPVIDDFRLPGDGDDWSPTFARAFASGVQAVCLTDGGIYVVNTDLIVPHSCSIIGGFAGDGLPPVGGSYYDLGSQIKLGGTASIHLGRGAKVAGLLAIRAGLAFPVTSVAGATALPGTFTGTAIIVDGDDADISNCLIIGHAQAIWSVGHGRVKVADVRMDCTAGVHIEGGYDICRIMDSHAYPFSTAEIAPGGHKSLRRAGDGFAFVGACDWSWGRNLFAYGHSRGYVQDGCSNVTWIQCKDDYTGQCNNGSDGGLASICAFAFINAVQYPSMDNCTSISKVDAVIHATTLTGPYPGNADGGMLRITGGTFATTNRCVWIKGTSGVEAIGLHFAAGQMAARIEDGTGKSRFMCYLGALGADFSMSANQARYVEIDMVNDGPTNFEGRKLSNLRIAPPDLQGVLTVEEQRGIAGGIGGKLVFAGPAAAGSFHYGHLRGSLFNASPGAEAADLVVATLSSGVEADRWVFQNDGPLVPAATNTTGDIGTSTHPIRQAVTQNLSVTTVRLASGGSLGLFGAPTTLQQTVSGSKASGAALASLIQALANYGLIIDGTS